MAIRLPPALAALPFTVAFLSAAIPSTAPAQLTGDSVAIRHAERMLGALGGRDAWARARTIAIELRGHFGSDSNPWAERYWIDLEAPRGRYQIRAGGSERIIVWTTEGGWESRDGAVESQSADRHALEQAYWAAELTVVFRRLAAARPATRLQRDTTAAGLSVITLLVPASADTIARLTLDAGGRPVHWAAPIRGRTFQRILGPLADYGGLRLPRWGATPDGLWRYEHLTASLITEPPPVSFARPEPAAVRPSASGLRGDPEAIEDSRAMVEAMGGAVIWRDLGSVHFVHEWDIYDRADRYLEHEILDLVAPRSYVTMDSELNRRVRAYSPEHRFWNTINGQFSFTSDADLADAMERAPFSIYRIARGVAANDGFYRVEFGPMRGLPGVTGLEFSGPDGIARGWILLNQRKEPVVWATTQYSYTFGPLERYGNLRVPRWATTGGGRVRYEMVSLTGSSRPADSTLFVPPRRQRDPFTW